MTKENGKPQIRFAKFKDTWEQRKLGEMMEVTSVKRIHQSDWTDSGVRFLRARDIVAESKKENVSEPLFISQEKYDEYSAVSGKVKKGDLLVTGVGTIGVPMLINSEEPLYFKDGNIIWFKNENVIDGRFFYYSFNGLNIQKFIKESAGLGTVGTYTIENGKKTPINLPPKKDEQAKIGEYFFNLDHLITLHQRKYDKLTKAKKSMLEKMFPKNGTNVPEIRFKGFTDAWEQRKSGDIAPLRGGFAFKSNEYCSEGVPIVRISNILSDGSVGSDFAYYNEQNYDEVYTLYDGAAVLAMSGATTGKVSVLYAEKGQKYYQNQRVGYFVPTDTCEYSFIRTIMRSQLFADQLSAVLVAGAQPNVSSKEIDGFEFMIPKSKDEQRWIGEYFTNLDNLITLHQRKLEKLKILKKACLEKMFV